MNAVRTLAIALSVLCLSAIGARSAAAAEPATMDVFDKPLRQVLTRDAPKLILYTNPNTRDSVSGAGPLMASHLKGINYITVVHVDLRGVPGFLMGFARKLMQTSQAETNEKNAEYMAAAGIRPKPEETDLTHVVMEPDGAGHELMGLAKDFRQGLAVVLDRAGREILRTPFPANTAAVENALRVAAQTPLSASQVPAAH